MTSLQQILTEAAKLPPADARRVLAALAAETEPASTADDHLADAAAIFEEAMLRAAIAALEETAPDSPSSV
jgi:hypothetical protein